MPTRDDAPIGAPCWIDLFTSDPDGARAFYGEVFGWESVAAGEEYGGYITFTKDGRSVSGGMRNDGSQGQPDAWTTYLRVDDADKVAEAVTAHGGQVHVPPMEIPTQGRMSLVADPSGAAIGMWEPAEHRGFQVWAEDGAPAWFELHTRDYDACVAFYREVFGWDTHTAGDSPDFRYTTLGEGDGQLAGIMDASSFLAADEPSRWLIYFGTDDSDATLATIVEQGGTHVSGPDDTPYGRLSTATDTTGVVFRLVQG
jgi:predicted enzyme related to lactoylglutathione lyase